MNERLTTYDSKMTKTINNLDGELATIRAGRANPHVLDKLTVDYYGSPTPIQHVFYSCKSIPLYLAIAATSLSPRPDRQQIMI